MFIVPPLHTSGIYQITCSPTGKFYIGSAQCIRKRWQQHCFLLDSGKHHNMYLQRAWRKHGAESFILTVLEHAPLELLIAREQEYLDLLQPFGNTGYNIAIHAENPMRGRKASAETRLKQSAAARLRPPHSEERLRKMSVAMMGHKRTPESIEKSAAAKRGKKIPEEQRLIIAEKKRLRGRKPLSDIARAKLAKLAIANRGRKHSPETIAKAIGRKHSPESIEKMRGRKWSEETRRKSLEKVVSEETRQKLSAAFKGRFVSEETRKKIAEARKRQVIKPHTEEAKQRMSERTLLQMSTHRHIVITPEGEELLVHLPSFCRENNLNYESMVATIRRKKTNKGYLVQRVSQAE